MNKKQPRSAPEAASFAQARDELFSHILRCGVIDALPEHQKDWFDDTMGYVADRYEGLSKEELAQLRILGERYCQPVRRVEVDRERHKPPERMTKRPGRIPGRFLIVCDRRSKPAPAIPQHDPHPPTDARLDRPARPGSGRSSIPRVSTR